MEITKRKLEEKDETRWKELLHQLNPSKVPLAKIKDLTENSNFYGLIIELEGKIVGFGSVSFFHSSFKGITGVIEDIIVDEKYRSKGLGKELMSSLLKEAEKRNAKVLTLTSNPNRKKARAIYEKLGFKLYDTGFFVKNL